MQATFVAPTAVPTPEPHVHPGHRGLVTPPSLPGMFAPRQVVFLRLQQFSFLLVIVL